jgi:hypothetical protein
MEIVIKIRRSKNEQSDEWTSASARQRSLKFLKCTVFGQMDVWGQNRNILNLFLTQNKRYQTNVACRALYMNVTGLRYLDQIFIKIDIFFEHFQGK